MNEFVAFTSMHSIQDGTSTDGFAPMTERSVNIVTYALCGFSNFSSIGMTVPHPLLLLRVSEA